MRSIMTGMYNYMIDEYESMTFPLNVLSLPLG